MSPSSCSLWPAPWTGTARFTWPPRHQAPRFTTQWTGHGLQSTPRWALIGSGYATPSRLQLIGSGYATPSQLSWLIWIRHTQSSAIDSVHWLESAADDWLQLIGSGYATSSQLQSIGSRYATPNHLQLIGSGCTTPLTAKGCIGGNTIHQIIRKNLAHSSQHFQFSVSVSVSGLSVSLSVCVSLSLLLSLSVSVSVHTCVERHCITFLYCDAFPHDIVRQLEFSSIC